MRGRLFENSFEEGNDGEKYLNKYDVIYLDITGFISRAFIKKELKNVVVNIQDEVTDELAKAYPEVERQKDLPEMLYQVSQAAGQKFIFIIVLNIGNAGFESVRKGVYVDKTGLISFINSTLGTMDKLIC
jgi:hypothetical protein